MSTTAIQIESSFPRNDAMPVSRQIHAYLTEAKYETLRMLRSPAFGIPFLTLPVALYLLFGIVIFGAIKDPKAIIQIFTGFDAFGVMGPGMFGFGVVVALEREQGLLTLKRALPMPPGAYLFAKMCMAMLFSGIITATMIIAALGVVHFSLSIVQIAGVAAINILGSLPFCALGLFIGTRTSGRSAPAITNVVYLAMIYLSGLFFPIPKALQAVMQASPAYHIEQLMLSAVGGAAEGAVIVHVAVLTGLTLLLVAVSLRRLARVG